MTVHVLMLSSRPPDRRALGGVELHAAALLLHAPSEVSVQAAYPKGAELLVQDRDGALRAALPLRVEERRAGESHHLSDALIAALRGVRADVLHMHSPALGPAELSRAIHVAGVRAVLSLHDHGLVCENYELLEGGTRYCGIPTDLGRCDACLEKTRGREPGAVQKWRSAVQTLLSVTDAVVAPSESVLEHAARLYPEIRGRAHRIPWGVPAPSARSTAGAKSGPLRVAVVGALAAVKGRRRLADLLSAGRDVDVEWHFFGATEGDSLRDVRRAARKVVVHGAYPRHALGRRLVGAGCHLALLPSVGAEAFSLTLSEVVSVGLPVLASDLGALGERVRGDGLGWTFDPWDVAAFRTLLEALDRDRARVDRVAAHVRSLPTRSEEQMTADHAELWARLAALPARPHPDAPISFDESFLAGRALANARRPSKLTRAVDDFRRSDFYRDLALRRAVPLAARKRLEDIVVRIRARWGRR